MNTPNLEIDIDSEDLLLPAPMTAEPTMRGNEAFITTPVVGKISKGATLTFSNGVEVIVPLDAEVKLEGFWADVSADVVDTAEERRQEYRKERQYEKTGTGSWL